MSKPVKMYILSLCNFLYINYVAIKLTSLKKELKEGQSFSKAHLKQLPFEKGSLKDTLTDHSTQVSAFYSSIK